MQLEIYQWVVPIISAYYIIRTARQYFRYRHSLSTLIVWTIFWLSIATLAIIPNPVSIKVAGWLGFKSNINAIIFVALGLLFLMIFYQSAQITKMELKMTELIRELAKDRYYKEHVQRTAEGQRQTTNGGQQTKNGKKPKNKGKRQTAKGRK